MNVLNRNISVYNKKTTAFVVTVLSIVFGISTAFCQTNLRTDISLDKGWRSVVDDNNKTAFDGFEKTTFNDKNWKQVDVPHNWDDYHGYRRMRHGNRHGYAWYRKRFTVKPQKAGQRYFLFFEGVGSYATVWLNGKKAGYHAGGRTTFTIDVTDKINLNNKSNILAVRADHPANIKDLPWVCGGCSDERGFSEGSQPLGIVRPVHLVITDPVRIEPFGVHIWNDTTVSSASAQLHLTTEVKNYGAVAKNITVVNRLENKNGVKIIETRTNQKVLPGTVALIKQEPPVISNPRLWSLEDPYLYNVVSEVVENGKVVDRLTIPYGIRWISWPIGKASSTNQFFLNGKPVFINGIAEYEHQLGKSHAFGAEQIKTRVMQMKAAGFNAFRDGHSPHNLRYNNYWDSLGILWWTQNGAHIWYDTPEFKTNFKKLLTEWVKERRNSPSIVMWGLQNESKLPTEFAQECTDLIRLLDPTSSSQRLVTTCNGGTGTDWDVPQNWTGTYGGDPTTYAEDVKRQILIGEYGAWRTLDLHTEGPFNQNGVYSEDRMTQLMEMKVRLAETVRDKAAGHYMWLFSSHDNPGRVQGGEGYREPDRIGPVNYKGLFTPWEEPLDVFYMYRSNYAPKEKEPMVYIVSHTWPDRWTKPGLKDSITVYSNCDEVELFNDVRTRSLGRRTRQGIGTHFQWDKVDVSYNVLYAVGYVNGKEVAVDYIVLNHLPQAPGFNLFSKDSKPIIAPQPNLNYLYRVNCGGPDYVDRNGNTWLADRNKTGNNTWGSVSWTKDFPGMPSYFASQRKTNDPVKGTMDWKLFQSFRYGREKLSYEFPVQDGEYWVELYFTEPWLGTGGGMDCTGWRLFDVAVNGKTELNDVDIWKEVGHDAALKRVVRAKVTGGKLVISFPRAASGQAVISAIAIATANAALKPAPRSPSIITNVKPTSNQTNNAWSPEEWLNTGDTLYTNDKIAFSSLPSNFYGAEWIRTPKITSETSKLVQFDVTTEADVFIGLDATIKQRPEWLKDFEDTKTVIKNNVGQEFIALRKRFPKGSTVSLGNNALNASMYTVTVVPASNIEPAYDLKTVTSYKAVNASLEGPGLTKGKVDGKERAIFEKASANNVLEWNIAVGAADTYSFTISYNNPHTKNITGKLQLLMADGTLMREENVEFTPTRPTKNNYINSSSGSMINAGNYKVRLTSKDAEGVSVNSLDVQ
ncbi:MAG: glycoside hydrolase [Segetibacter sp.]|nr:glycoside hydrolase [Segetibacter sp.]